MRLLRLIVLWVVGSVWPGRGVLAQSVVIENVSVVDLAGARIIPHRSVVLEGGRVRAISAAPPPAAPGERRIDGRGRFLMPGLADLHVHLFNSRDLLLYVAHGVTTIRNLGGYGAADSILRIRRAVRDGKLLGPTIFTSGNWLDGDPPARSINTVVRTPEEAARQVAAQSAAGYDFIKVYAALDPRVYRAVLETARAEGMPVTGHVPAAVEIERALEAGQVAIDHLAQFPLAEAARLDALVGRTRERGVAVVSTLVMLQRALAMRGDPGYLQKLLAGPEARYVSPATREFWRRSPFVGLPRSGASDARYPGAERLARLLVDRDARLVLGTDAGLWGNPPGFSAVEELKLLVAAGLTPAQALRAATLTPAAFLNRHVPGADQPGPIEVGMRADLLLLEGNPLEDIAWVERRAGVVLRGRWLPQAELRDSLERLAADYER